MTGMAHRTDKLRVSEIYSSVQGEGPRTGMGTIFLRFAGCNLRCPGWPCDTQYAIDPKYRNEWDRRSGRDVLGEVTRLAGELNVSNICLTGGEPFLQQSGILEYLVRGLLAKDINVEAFSNGQVRYPDWAFELVQFIMDWKLPGSGNSAMRDMRTADLFLNNIRQLKATDAIKFVIKDEIDFDVAKTYWEEYEDKTPAQWWAGVVWESDMTEAVLTELIQDEQLPWNLNVQTHKYLWPAEKRGV